MLRKIASEARKDTATRRMVMRCVQVLPSTLPNSPAASAPSKGASGTSKYRFCIFSKLFISAPLTLQSAEIIHVDGTQVAEQNHQDGQAYRRFRRKYSQNEEHEYLPGCV